MEEEGGSYNDDVEDGKYRHCTYKYGYYLFTDFSVCSIRDQLKSNEMRSDEISQ